jgi:hypothetical protein
MLKKDFYLSFMYLKGISFLGKEDEWVDNWKVNEIQMGLMVYIF